VAVRFVETYGLFKFSIFIIDFTGLGLKPRSFALETCTLTQSGSPIQAPLILYFNQITKKYFKKKKKEKNEHICILFSRFHITH
jgi:hypothetical protein